MLGEFHTLSLLASTSICFNTSSMRRKKRPETPKLVNVGSRIVMTQEGCQLALEQKEARLEKTRKAEEGLQKKRDAQVKVQARHAWEGHDGMVFAGSLNTQKRPALQDIAWALQLSEDGTGEVLITRIKEQENSHLRDNNRFKVLFGKQPTNRRTAEEETRPVPDPSNNTHPDDNLQIRFMDSSSMTSRIASSSRHEPALNQSHISVLLVPSRKPMFQGPSRDRTRRSSCPLSGTDILN
jgi:hypothetical protein